MCCGCVCQGQVEELRQRVGDKLTEHMSVQRRGAQKVMAEHDKLGRDLTREAKERQRLAAQLAEKETVVTKLETHVKQLEMRLQDARDEQNPNYDAMDLQK